MLTEVIASAVVANPLTDPTAADLIGAAGAWIQVNMTGTVATAVAVIAVAIVGLLMLSVRIDWRCGVTVFNVDRCLILAPVRLRGGSASMRSQAKHRVARLTALSTLRNVRDLSKRITPPLRVSSYRVSCD